MMTEQLKPCPFCGGEAKVDKYKSKYITEVYVMCTECFCKTDSYYINTYYNIYNRTDEECIKYAVEAWNRRVKE